MTETSDTLLHEAMVHERLGEQAKARDCLDALLRQDPDNHLAWYQKSKLAVLQSDDVSLDGHIVSVARYQSLPLALRRDYLQQCGFDIVDIENAEARLRQPNLLAEQRLRFLNMAVQTAPAEAARFYRDELATLDVQAANRRRHDQRTVLLVGLAALVVSVLAAVTVALRWSAGTPIGLPWAIALLVVAYVLSVVGMSLYVHARDKLGATPAGLAVNLIALVLAILSVVALIINLIAQ